MLVNPSFAHIGFSLSQNLDVALHDSGSTSGRCWHLYLLCALMSRSLRPRDLHSLPPPPGVAPPSTESSTSKVPSSVRPRVGTPRDIREGFVVGGGM